MMLRPWFWAAAGLPLLWAGCSSSVETHASGGAGGTIPGTTASSSSAGGAGGTETIDAGDAGDAPADAPSDAPPGPCVSAEDCPLPADPCMGPACVEGVCGGEPAFDFAACDDGDYCTENDYCSGGLCVGSPLVCPGVDACNYGVCDPVTKKCLLTPANDGVSCDDGNACTGGGLCAGGVCQPGAPVNCAFLDGPCVHGVCDPQQGCVAAPDTNGTLCDDNLFCTVNDHCLNGACLGSPNLCPSSNPCFVGVCNEATNSCGTTPGNNGAACDDGNVCTSGTTCLNGSCLGGVPANNGAACDDGSACTSNTVCQNGTCGGGQGPIVYFADDFHDNSKGWTLGMEWQIGATMVSSGQQGGHPDPALDHTATNDNGVAGVALGGNAIVAAGNPLHGYYYLTSPAFSTAGAAGSVMLGFYRWLNSDQSPYMVNVVEVWNGTVWVQLWKSGTTSISDAQWTFVSHDLTAYKNAAMQIRFGFDIEKVSVFKVSSWNIDDVLVASAACP